MPPGSSLSIPCDSLKKPEIIEYTPRQEDLLQMTILFTSENRGVVSGASSTNYHCRAIFMFRNNEKAFVANRNIAVPMSPWPSDDNTSDIQAYTDQLVSNHGQFLCLHGRCLSPFDFLGWMEEHHYLFGRDCRKLRVRKSCDGFVDVKGNLLQVSSSFHYRFFDTEVFEKWLKRVDEIDPESCTERAA